MCCAHLHLQPGTRLHSLLQLSRDFLSTQLPVFLQVLTLLDTINQPLLKHRCGFTDITHSDLFSHFYCIILGLHSLLTPLANVALPELSSVTTATYSPGSIYSHLSIIGLYSRLLNVWCRSQSQAWPLVLGSQLFLRLFHLAYLMTKLSSICLKSRSVIHSYISAERSQWTGDCSRHWGDSSK